MKEFDLETRILKLPRECDSCGTKIDEGYLYEDINKTYCRSICAIDCLGRARARMAWEYGKMFWTDWYDEVEEVE